MSYLTRVLGNTFGIATRIHALSVADTDPRTLADLGMSGDAAKQARFQSFRAGEPGASNAARLGLNGR
ncbi:hypothetical protein [Stappia sp. 28M-7]|jgi:hypothetical protein|uniref:hypothetical protein n=1 Tax=Stappia sp. 28M-7 TaxID=2762596 RepID=UPI000E770306|nr:hypothetical protein [Stappia sp. 28M-7]MBC2859478.1 hypothetical protein [Stappia sp. 28M-7]